MNDPVQLDAMSQESLVAEIADEFIQRVGRGEQPDLDEYVKRHPQVADVLRHVLPALELMRYPAADTEAGTDLPDERLQTGRLGDYRIFREVGRGGMGIVYEAEQLSLGRKVALKVLPFAAMLDQKQLQRFQNEARAAASLRHPNIVQIHFVGCERAVHFYAMDYIEGQNLAELIRHMRRLEGSEGEVPEDAGKAVSNLADSLASGRFAPPQAGSDRDAPTTAYTQARTPGATAETARVPQAAISTERSTKGPSYFRSIAELGVQVAEALDHAHQHGVIHRDVKPSNVILDNGGKPWVTDFGLARIETDATLTVSGDLLGTVRYMSPEQALAKRIVVDHRTDVYSLGATLYELLTLRPVFSGQDRQELLRQIAFDEPKAPRKLNKAIPAELETIVTKAMAKNPAERYDTSQKLADDLKRFLEDKPIHARRATTVQRVAKWSRRHKPIVVSTAVVSAVVLVVVAVGTALIAAKERDNRLVAEQANRQAERLLTASYVDRAQALCEEGEIGRGMLWLAHSIRTAPEDATELEHIIRTNLAAWHPQLHSLKTLVQDDREVRAVAFSPDGSRILTMSGWRFVRLWDAATGQPIGNPINHKGLSAIAFSPNGSRIVTGSNDGTAQLWDAATLKPIGEPLEQKKGSRRVVAVAFSPDGLRFVTGSAGGTVGLWDAATGRAVREPFQHQEIDREHTTHWVRALAITPVGTRACITIGEGIHQIWDTDQGEPIGPPVVNTPDTYAVAISLDASRILTESDGALRLRDAVTGQPIGKPFPHQNRRRMMLTFSPDGSRVLIANSLWEVATGELVGQLSGGLVHDGAFSPDGSRILTGFQRRGREGGGGFGQLWDAETAKPIGQPFQHQDTVSRVAFSPDGSRLLTGSYDATTRFWDAETLERIGQPLNHQSELKALAYSPDGDYIATGFADWTVRLWDARTRKPIGLPLHHQNIVCSAAFSPDGSRLLTASLKTVRLWDVATLKPIGPPLRHESHWPRVSFSPDGSRMLEADRYGAAQVWKSPPGPLGGDRERILVWAQVVTGLELDRSGGIGVLDGPAWKKLHQRLRELRGPPTAASLPGPVSRAADSKQAGENRISP